MWKSAKGGRSRLTASVKSDLVQMSDGRYELLRQQLDGRQVPEYVTSFGEEGCKVVLNVGEDKEDLAALPRAVD